MGDNQHNQQGGNGHQQNYQGQNYQGNQGNYPQNYSQQNYQQQPYQNVNGYWQGHQQQEQQMYEQGRGGGYNQHYIPQQQGRGGGGGGNYGYMNQQQHQHQQQQQSNDYYGYEGAENFDQDDYENLEAIEKAMSGSRNPSPNGDQYGEFVDEEDRAMAELEEEMNRTRVRTTGSSNRGGGSSGSYLPAGAVPRQNGVLSVHAKEFWFPECRNCTCCKGFKHGCDCCAGGVDTCAKGDCVDAAHITQVATDLASRPSPAVTVAATAPVSVPSSVTHRAPTSTPRAAGAYLPPGAVPSSNGVLSVHAKEFWFPECRNCTCCKGFKHGCDCCAGGVDTCAKGDCVDAAHITQVATELAAKAGTSEKAVDPSSDSVATGLAASLSIAAEISGLNLTVKAPAPVAHVGKITHTTSGGGSNGGAEETCKYYMSGGGCRFGDSCRFKHSGAMPPAPGPSGGNDICPFFISGTCQYGDSCRKSHNTYEASGAYPSNMGQYM